MMPIIFSKIEISAINAIKKIVEKYGIKYFKITNTTVYYKNDGLKYYVNKNIIENELFTDDEEDELIFTDDNEEVVEKTINNKKRKIKNDLHHRNKKQMYNEDFERRVKDVNNEKSKTNNSVSNEEGDVDGGAEGEAYSEQVEQVVNNNSLSNEDVNMIEVHTVVNGSDEVEDNESSVNIISTDENLFGSNSELVVIDDSVSNGAKGEDNRVEVAKTNDKENAYSSLSNEDVSMIEVHAVDNGSAEVEDNESSVNNISTDENLFGSNSEHVVNNNAVSNDVNGSAEVQNAENAFIFEYYGDVESALNITNDYSNFWPQETSLNVNAVEMSSTSQVIGSSHFEHQVCSSTYLQSSETNDWIDYFSQNLNLSLYSDESDKIDNGINLLDTRKSLKESKRLLKENDLIDSIITVANPNHRNFENLNYSENNNFSNILENCVIAEIKAESQKCELLQNYYKTGAYLNKILEYLMNELSEIEERSIVTGILKGSGISKIYYTKYGNYGEAVQKKARRLYYSSLRVYQVYSLFPNPEHQIFRANDKVSADALLKVGKGGKNGFTEFLNVIKSHVESNYEKYNDDIIYRKNIFDFNLITEDIKLNVKKFCVNPKLSFL